MSTDLSRLVLRDTVNFLRKALKSQPPDLPQVPGEKPILRTSEKDGEQLRSENTPFPEGPEPLNQEVSTWRQKGQEKEGEERLEPSKACMEPVPKDQASQSPSRAGPGLQAVPPPDLPAEHAGAGTRGVQPKRGAGSGDQPAHRAAVDLKGVPEDAGCPGSPPSPEGEQQHRARRLWAERRETAELTRQIHSLHTQEASLQKATSQLRLNLQNPLDEQDQCILQLHRKVFQAEAQCLEMKKKLASVYREMNFTCQIRNLYKKMAQDLGKELERTTSYYRKLVLFHQGRATKSWVGAAPREREFQELREENDRLRRMLAAHCLEMENKLASVYREMNFTCQIHNLYKKMAQDPGKELERNTSHYRKVVLFHQDRATKSWVEAASRS
uniref:cTAGE family member 9-like n=1 Tax=Halichoerus grypus TaxID=9711 RepID=UPI00165A0733|nr:cTAGE family member 9-like [Halichoerus grypus]